MNKKETNSYKGWLNSDCFLKRAFSVWWYSLVPNLIFSVIIGIILFLTVWTVILANYKNLSHIEWSQITIDDNWVTIEPREENNEDSSN